MTHRNDSKDEPVSFFELFLVVSQLFLLPLSNPSALGQVSFYLKTTKFIKKPQPHWFIMSSARWGSSLDKVLLKMAKCLKLTIIFIFAIFFHFILSLAERIFGISF